MVDRLKRPGKATLHLTVDSEVKAAAGKDISEKVNQYLRARYLGVKGNIKQVDEEIEKLKATIDEAQGKIAILIGKKEAMQIEQERVEQAEAKAIQNRRYAKYVYLKQILRGEGSLAGRQTAIRLAFGVMIKGEAATWAFTQWKKYFSGQYGVDELRIPDGFLEDLDKWFNEAAGYVSYVGGGKDEDKEYQEYVDVSSESKKLCFKGHAYSALEKFCPSCTVTKDYHFIFRDGELAGYHSLIKEKEAFVKWRKLGDEEKEKLLHGVPEVDGIKQLTGSATE